MDEASADRFNTITLSAEIVAAYVKNNSVSASELPKLLTTVHAALSGIAAGHSASAPATEPTVEKPTPVQIRKSITPDALISFIDGKPYKTLKRHLSTYGLDPQSYRQRYELPNDYPMVAENYAARRSALARDIGLGQSGGGSEQ